MRLHLPVSLFRSLLTCFAAVAVTTLGSLTAPASASTPEDELLMLLAEQEYPNGSITYTTWQDSVLTLTRYESITFKSIRSLTDSFSTYYSARGGAIQNRGGEGSCALSGNDNVSFISNTSSFLSYSPSVSYFAYGGAIYSTRTFILNDNRTVVFSKNDALISPGSAKDKTSSYAYGGAIYNSGLFSLIENDDVSFSANRALAYATSASSSYGGAIYNAGVNAVFNLCGNGDVSFLNNSSPVTSTYTHADYSSGGAIYNARAFSLDNNGIVLFRENKAYIPDTARGGAICSMPEEFGSEVTFSLCDNDAVIFESNSAYVSSYSSSYSSAYGGAIYNGGQFLLTGNGSVSFIENSTSTSTKSVYGGAIYNYDASFEVSGNGNVLFEGNSASAATNGYGGAINNGYHASFIVHNNKSVTFRKNSLSSSFNYGGAVYNVGSFLLYGNGDVIFEKNLEKNGESFRLRSIYSVGELDLSASAGHSITFRDSVYASGAVYLNMLGSGDIVFTGFSTEADLLDIKGSAGTMAEIRNSRTSELVTETTLYGGRLVVEDGAILKGNGIRTEAGAIATILVRHATIDFGDGCMSFDNGSCLRTEGISSVTASSITLGSDCTLSFLVGAENRDTAVLTYSGDLSFTDEAILTLSCDFSLSPGTYKLLSMASGNQASTGISCDSVKLLDHTWEALDAYWQNSSFYVELGRKDADYILLNAATPTNDNGWGMVGYAFEHTYLNLQGDWQPRTGNPDDVLGVNWKGYSGEKLELTGQGRIDLNHGWLYCNGGAEFNIGKDICLKNTSLSADGGSTVIFNGSVELTPTSWPIQFNVRENSVLDITHADLTSSFGAFMLYLNGGRVVCSSYTVDAQHLLNYSEGINGGICSWKGNLTLGSAGRVCVTSSDCSVPLAVEGDILVKGNTVFLALTDMMGWTEGITLMTCTGKVIGDTSQLQVGVLSEGMYSPLDSFETSELRVEVVNYGTGYALVTSASRTQSLTWESAKGVWRNECPIGTETFQAGDAVLFPTAATVTISGAVEPGKVEISSEGNVTFISDTKVGGSGIAGSASLTKTGAGTLTLNGANTYSGGTEMKGGTLAAGHASAFGTGAISLAAGTLNLNAKAVTNAIQASGGTISGGSAYAGALSVTGDVSLSGMLKASSLTLKSGSLTGGTLSDMTVYAEKGSLGSSFAGQSALVGQNYTLAAALTNTGTLTLSGTLDASALTKTPIAGSMVALDGTHGNTGFVVSGLYSVRLVTGGTVKNGGVSISYGSDTLTLQADGTARHEGSTIDYGTYFIGNGVSLSTTQLHRTAAGAAVEMSGGTLTVNDTTTVKATAGSVLLQGGVLNGQLTNTAVTSSSGSIHAAMSGTSTLSVNGNTTVDGALSLSSLALRQGVLTAEIATGSVTAMTVSGGSLNGGLTLNGGTLNLGKNSLNVTGTLFLESSTALTLDLSAYRDDDVYTLISAGIVVGDVSNLRLNAASTGRIAYTLSTNGADLLLTVESHAQELRWIAPKGIWAEDSAVGTGTFCNGDTMIFTAPAAVTVSGAVAPGKIMVNSSGNVTFTSDKKAYGSGIEGDATLSKSGDGLLTMNAGNTYSGGTELNAGTLKATAADSFGTGVITVKGGTLDLGGKAVANDIVLRDKAKVTLKGDAKYTGHVTVEGNATLLAKASYKGLTTIGADSSLTLELKTTMAGNIEVSGGTLRIRDAKGVTLGKGQTLTLDGGSVSGLVTIGAGGTLQWNECSMRTAPVLKGGTLDFGGAAALTLTGAKAQVQFGDNCVDLLGKGIVKTEAALIVKGGTVTVNALSGYEGDIAVEGGMLKLAAKETAFNEMSVTGSAAVVNGKMHVGDITVTGTLAKGTNITIADGKTVKLNGEGALIGTIAGAGSVDVSESIDATAAKITAAHLNLNNGTFINTKGIKLAKGQTLCLNGAALDLGAKGSLVTAAGSTLVVGSATELTGSLTLGGGELVFDGGELHVSGMLTLSKPMSVTGSGSITFGSLKPIKGELSALFGGVEVEQEGTTLTIRGGEPLRMAAAPLDTAALTPLMAVLAPLPTPAPEPNPVADALVQADWGILDAERAFLGAVKDRHQHAALLDKGRGAAWVSAFGASVRHGSKGGHHGSDGNLCGAAFGLEHAVSETGTVGLAVGRSTNRIAATGVTHLRQETAHVALYGQKHLAHGFTADAAAAWGDTETKLGGSTLSQKSAALTARLTQAQQLNDATSFRTFGGLSYEATDSGSLGATHTGSVQNLRAELGAGATHSVGKAHLYAEAALTGDLLRHNPTADLDGSRTHGANPGRLGLRATVGGLYEFTDTWSGTASYSVETEARSTSHTLNIGVSKQF